MIEVVPLALEHLAAFEHVSREAIPEDQFGQAAVFLDDSRPLAICIVWDNEGVAEVGVVMSEAARRYPVSMHRLAQLMLVGLHASGYQCIRAHAETPRAVEWLRRLGFNEVDGAFEKWPTQ